MSDDEAGPKPPDVGAQPAEQQESQVENGDSRLICHFLLIIALIFVVTAMEDGSYRTPWPFAILVLAGALGLCFRLRGKKRTGF